MNKEATPFFSIEDIYHSQIIHSCKFNFYFIEKKQKNVLIGHCLKDLNKKNQKQLSMKFQKNSSFWDKQELYKISLMITKEQYPRLYEWILTRILLKLGLPIFLKSLKSNYKISAKNIILKTEPAKKPSICITSETKSNIFNDTPFVSITHTNSNVYIALFAKPIGIDNEIVKKHSEAWEKKIFSENELQKFIDYLRKWKIDSQKVIYTIMWGLKESTLKADGNFMIGDLPEITINILNEEIITRIPKSNKTYQNLISIMNNSILSLTF